MHLAGALPLDSGRRRRCERWTDQRADLPVILVGPVGSRADGRGKQHRRESKADHSGEQHG
jgi:hypothetical protein